MNAKATIYTVFTSSGLSGSSFTYPMHHPGQKLMTNEKIMDELRYRCGDIEFTGTTEIEKPEYAIANIKAQRHNLDGVLYFGAPPVDLLNEDIPIVAVHPLWAQWQEPFNKYSGHKVLTATLPVIPDVSPEQFAERMDKIENQIKSLHSVSQLKSLRILCITDKPVLGEYEPDGFQLAEEGWDVYEQNYLQNLRGLGTEIITRPQKELVKRMKTMPEDAAKEIARKWIEEAEDVKGTNESEVQKSAKLYLAMQDMMTEHNAGAITTEGYGFFINYPDGPIPSQGLPSSQFCTDGVVATSETLFDSLITQQLGLFKTGNTGFNGDYIIDPENNKAYIGHCECPFNPYGADQKVPYVIRNLPQYPIEEQEKGGACVQVRLPDNEEVTLAKFSVHDKKLSLFRGQTVPGEDLFPGWDDILCRTKLAIDTDADQLLENVRWSIFGHHRVAFYGDYTEYFKSIATLMGYEIVQGG